MAGTGGVTQIDKTYLNGLKSQLNDILNDVNNQLKGIGASGDPNVTAWINPVDKTLSVAAGGTPGSSGSSSFNAATALNTALHNMGGSVHDQLVWLHKVLTDMINEITTTVDSFSSTESLNAEAVDQLISDFQSTINDMNNPPGSGPSQPPPGA